MDLPGVHTCWTLRDARAILASARPGTRVVQMGAGFVGCIIMEGLLSRGVDLTILVRSGYMVRRMMNPTASGLIRRWCEEKGVKILTRTQPRGAQRGRTAPCDVDLGDGRSLPADIYLSAIGVDPNLDFLAGTAIAVRQGILVDDTLQTQRARRLRGGRRRRIHRLPDREASAQRHPAERRGAGADCGAEHGRPARALQGQLRVQRAHDARPRFLVVRRVGGRAGRGVAPKCSTRRATAT